MKVALYCRVSKSDGTQSADRQVMDLRKYASEKGWMIVEEVVEHISGTITKRSGTTKLINLAKSNQIQKVLVHEISRLGRNIADVFNTIEELTNAKVSVYDLRQNQETLDENYNKTVYASLILPVLAGLNEEWIRQHRYRIKSGLERARATGKKLGRPKSIKVKKQEQIIECFKKGLSYRKIAKELGIAVATILKVKKLGLV